MKTTSARFVIQLCLILSLLVISNNARSAVMNDYCVQPPFIAATVPPLVMFEMGRDHKLYYESYSDSADLDEDGILDITYKHSIDYYGYFDPFKCYQYNTGGTDKFDPVSHTTTKFCSNAGGQWSGNILNWLTMSRIDVLKKVLYGGHRSADSTSETVLERATIPQDAHSWGKEFTGRLCYNATGTPQYTYSCSIDSDCAAGYACTDKSMELVGFAQAGLSTCSASTPGTTNNKMLVVRYKHPAGLTAAQGAGDTHTDLLASYADATEPLTATFLDYDIAVTNFGTSGSKIDPTQNHLDNYSTMVVAEFKTSSGSGSETWQFMVDSDDGAEVEIFTTATTPTSLGVIASHYGAHSSCSTAPTTACSGMVTGSISLSKSSTWYRLVVRASEVSGQDGVRVWYKNPSKTSWTLFGTTNLGNNNMRTFDITSSNQCTLYASEFINKGKPTSGATSQDSSKFHMVCNTTLSATGAPLMRLLQNVSGKRIWDWASKERPVCDTSLGTPTDYDVRVKVCDSTIDTADQLDIKKSEIGDSCKWYPGSGSGLWKPVGLLQQYGEGDGSKVCSKSMSKACATDAGCTFATEGKCVDKADMYFGMMTTSYTKNTSGGVLRKNIGAILDESNANNGIFQSSENSQGNIILTFDRLKPVGFQYSDWSYQDSTGGSCGWITDRPIAEGECRSWGNPIAEMMYESLRYYAGRLTPTSDFTYSASQDSGLSLSKPDWGYKDGSTAKALYEIYPSCAKPFILLLSDTNTSYDSDQIPGSSFKKPDGTSFAEDTPVLLKLGETQSSGRSLLNELSYTIGQTENIHGNSWYIGENGTLKDFLCTGKTASNFSLLRGMCPEEPTKMGSYYSAALAYYGKAKFKSITGKPDVNTFVVALSSPFSDLQIKTGSGTISILPTAKSVSGCSNAYAGCSQRMNLTYDATYGLRLNQKSPADSAAYCPTNTIVDYYVDDIRYDSSNNVTYALFRINYEDVEQGADHDMDSIVKYEICTATAATNGYGSCGTSSLAANQIEVKLVSDYAAGCIDQVMGFVISGTTEDGVYLPVKDADVGSSDSDTPTVVADMPLTWSKEFTIGTTSAAKSLKNPLWYAAKWGGFEDKNGNNVPDQREEWAKDCTATDVSQCNPDNYYQVVNPLKLRRQLNKALTDILRRVTSGTAASILNNSEGSGANLLQAVFYPAKSFDSNTETQWIGEMQNLWYFLDPALQKTSIREDSNQNNSLNLKTDKVAQFYFDASENKTLVKLFSDANGDGAADSSTPDSTVTPDEVKSLWKAGRMLWERNVSADPRTIYTGYNSTLGNTPQKFSNLPVDGYFNTWPNTWSILQIPAGTNAEREALATKLISFTHGSDQADDTAPCLNSDCKYRSRKVTLLNCNTGSNAGRVPDGVCNREWKLGDIISSTPKLISNVPLNQYDLSTPRGYNDTSYKTFTESNTYKHRGMALVGGNDGMLHAFKLGVLKELKTKFDKAQMNDASDNLADASDKLGREEWAFIPKNSLPYLRYLSETGYNHLYYVDRTPTIFDASIGKPAGCGTDYSDCSKLNDGTTWRTIVIGGMGIGGASRDTANACSTSTDCVKNPLAGNGYSSYFALDVTDPATPKYLWEFAGDPASLGSLGYSTTGPAIVRIAKKDASGHPDNTKNGKWFAVFASGPTGPIDTTAHQFKGQSDQNLKLFIVDIGTGALVKTIDTGLANAFAGSLASSWIDADRSNTTSNGFYSDDAIYIGYVQKDTSVTPNTWTKGGVLRLLTRESDDPASSTATKQWSLSTLISGTGPVTTSVTKLQDRNNKTLWVYFGTGRFFYKADDPTTGTNQKLYGVKEPCYSTATRTMTSVVAGGTTNDLDQNCTDAVPSGIVDQSGNATTAPASTLAASAPGWLISLDAADSSALSERVITDSVASSAGAVFFTTFKPSADICKFGGDSLIWAVNYATGGLPPAKSMQGKALMQVSTGAFAEISLSEAFNSATGNKREHGRRLNTPISGVPPTAQGLSVITNPPPVKKFLHVREK